MENNKYYTPTIEEFHVGFEYESAETFMDGTVKTQEDFNNAKWVNNAFVNLYEFPYILRVLNGKNAENGICGIRVKCLDKEDIESLDWKPFGGEGNPYCLLCKNGSCFYLWMTPNIISINKGMVGDLVKDSAQVFRGTIKNKSELKKLMAQLGIK